MWSYIGAVASVGPAANELNEFIKVFTYKLNQNCSKDNQNLYIVKIYYAVIVESGYFTNAVRFFGIGVVVWRTDAFVYVNFLVSLQLIWSVFQCICADIQCWIPHTMCNRNKILINFLLASSQVFFFNPCHWFWLIDIFPRCQCAGAYDYHTFMWKYPDKLTTKPLYM